MPLISLQQTAPETVAEFTIKQVVSFAGDGDLKDGSSCAEELKEYLSQISSDKIEQYVSQCLTDTFDKSGLVLQDLVNEVGRRLDYSVSHGLYSGRKGQIGYDGLWESPDGQHLVVEVKTTDAYRMSMETIANYRSRLIETGRIGQTSSILIVVGREDTGELEAQVRGSKHAWDIRLISAEALVKMMRLKESSDEDETGQKLRNILSPVEYTRVDALVDVVFATAQDIEADVELSDEEQPARTMGKRTIDLTDGAILKKKREEMVSSVSSLLNVKLLKRSRATFWSSDRKSRAVCSISKRYENGPGYWYAYHPKWRSFLAEGDKKVFVLGCIGRKDCFAIPADFMEPLLPKLNQTGKDEKAYWHIHLAESEEGKVSLVIPKEMNLDIMQFSVPLLI